MKIYLALRSNREKKTWRSKDQLSSGPTDLDQEHSVTNEDIMRNLCANGKEIAKLSQCVEELQSTYFTLQTENTWS